MGIPAENINLADIVENAVSSVASSYTEPGPALAPDSDARRALIAVGFSERDLRPVAELFARWDAFRKFFSKVSQKRDPEPVDLEPYGDLSADQRLHAFLDGFTQDTHFPGVANQAASIIRLLEAMGVHVELESSTGTASQFHVTAERKGTAIALTPRVQLGAGGKVGAHGIVMLLHELGHAALHSRWMGELSLMLYCSDVIETTRPFAAAHVREVASAARRCMIRMHSAVERAADRFAIRFLLTPSWVEQLRTAFVERGGGVRIFDLDTMIQVKLGVDHHTYYDRFGPLIWPSLGMGGFATGGAIPLTPKILDAMDRTSDRRIEKLLRDHWRMVRTVLEEPDAAIEVGRPSAGALPGCNLTASSVTRRGRRNARDDESAAPRGRGP